MDRARAIRAFEALYLAASGDSTKINELIDEFHAELVNAGWTDSMGPATSLSGIGAPKPAALEPVPVAPEAAKGYEPAAAAPAHHTMHVDVELEGDKVVGAHSVEEKPTTGL